MNSMGLRLRVWLAGESEDGEGGDDDERSGRNDWLAGWLYVTDGIPPRTYTIQALWPCSLISPLYTLDPLPSLSHRSHSQSEALTSFESGIPPMSVDHLNDSAAPPPIESLEVQRRVGCLISFFFWWSVCGGVSCTRLANSLTGNGILLPKNRSTSATVNEGQARQRRQGGMMIRRRMLDKI